MTIDEMYNFMESHNDEYIKFDHVANPLSQRPDLHAFLLLDRLSPGAMDMVSGAEHDEIYLDASPLMIATAATESDLLDLVRCGVRYSKKYDCFCMFA